MSFYNIKNEKSDNPEIMIYKSIGSGFLDMSVSAKKFIEDVKALQSSNITIRLNSPGGSVFEGLAIYNFLKHSEKKVKVVVDGIAASIASIILLAGDVRQIANGAMVMIHNPSGAVQGDSESVRKLADTLDKIKDQLVEIYHENTQIAKDQLVEMMDKETWFSAKEAKEKGFVTDLLNNVKATAEFNSFPYITNNFEAFRSRASSRSGASLREQSLEQEQTHKETHTMNEIFNLLGVGNETEAKAKIQTMMNEKASLEQTVQTLTNKQNEQRIELCIAQQKISVAQKDFATELLNLNESTFENWLSTNKPALPPMENLSVPKNENGTTLTFEDLLEDPELEEKTKSENPNLYNKLYNEYIGG